MFDDLNELYQQVILDHSRSPRNFGKLAGANRTAQGHNPLCGDNVTLYLKLDGEVIQDIRF
ncbi:MAG: iron-sulfur cluster assembly scaffold protein, partial [Verrucomicrobia bacterium]|nr:iron-sulfur cluster assembly scaffold protein [Verrucomicrobiota bacterium]